VAGKRPSARLRQRLKLARRKEKLLAQVQDIDRAMLRLEQEFRTVRPRKKQQATVTISAEPNRQSAVVRRKRKPR
jgi:hypothetical protein